MLPSPLDLTHYLVLGIIADLIPEGEALLAVQLVDDSDGAELTQRWHRRMESLTLGLSDIFFWVSE